MFARINFSTLTLKDALDLACLIEYEAFKRYTQFAAQLGDRHDGDAASSFRAMATNEKKHGQELEQRRKARFGDAPATVKLDDLFDVEAPEEGAIYRNMSTLKALRVALASEEKARAFYDEALPHVTDAEVRTLFQELRDEEIEHVRLVNELIAKLPPQARKDEEDVDELE